MILLRILRAIVRYFNIDIKRYPEIDLTRRKKLLDHFKINTIIDVGANRGQYALEVLGLGFKGNIYSYEPLKNAFEDLNKHAKKNPNWFAFNYGLGDKEGQATINVSRNSFSSSILELKSSSVPYAPDSLVIDKENIQIKKLDTVFDDIIKPDDIILLKMDVQGFEKNVLEGSKNSLSKIKGIQLEMSIEELYKGELLFDEMILYLKEIGFNLYSLENGFYNVKTGRLLQVDGIFFR